jgi:hypothetical protein
VGGAGVVGGGPGGAAPDLGRVSEEAGVPPSGLLRLEDDFAVGTRTGSGTIELPSFTQADNGTWRSDVIGTAQRAAPHTVSTVSFEGDTGDAWNGFVYGSADARASDVQVDLPGATGGTVAGSGWVVALPDCEIPPDFAWTVLDSQGAITASGTGVGPPMP